MDSFHHLLVNKCRPQATPSQTGLGLVSYQCPRLCNAPGEVKVEQDQLAHARRCRQALDRTYSLSPFISGCVSEHAIHSSFRVCRRRDAVEVGRSLPRRHRAWNYSSQQIQGRPRLLVGGPKLRPHLLPPPPTAPTRLKAAKPRSRNCWEPVLRSLSQTGQSGKR